MVYYMHLCEKVKGFLKKSKKYLLFFMHHGAIMMEKEVHHMSIGKIMVGQRIKERRVAMGLSQRDLAAALDYSNHSTIARIEAGKVDLPQSKIVLFADALHTTPAFLMGWDKEPEDLADLAATILQDKDLLAMIEKYLAMGAADQRAMQAMADALTVKKG